MILDCVEKEGRDARLLERAKNCLLGNVIQGTEAMKALRVVRPSKDHSGAWNWDSAFHAMAISRWDVDFAFEQCKIFFENQNEKGMFIDAILTDGTIYDTASKPPVFAWAFVELCKRGGDKYLNEENYNVLVKNEQFWTTYRKYGELFHYDAFDTDVNYLCSCKNESGWDTSVRWDKGAQLFWAVDLNCYMYMFYGALSYLAEKLGKTQDMILWKDKQERLKNSINQLLWNEELQCYCDVHYYTMTASPVIAPSAFMPLYVHIADEKQAKAMCALAQDKNKFYPLMPTVSYDNKEYNEVNFWRGPTWLNVAYFAIKGLKNYGFIELAENYKENILNMCDREERGIFEYYNSKTGKGMGACQFSWSAVFIMEFIINF